MVARHTKRIPNACNEENFSRRNIIPKMTAIKGLIEDIGVARAEPINSIEEKKDTAPIPQFWIPTKPKMISRRIVNKG